MPRLTPDFKSLLTADSFNHTTAELRERAEQAGYDIGSDGLCLECDGRLTEADLELGACTQCNAEIPALSEDGDNEEEG